MVVLIVAAIGCYAMSLAPVTWVVISEIFPNRIRGAAVSVAVLALWTACTVLTFTFPLSQSLLGSARHVLALCGDLRRRLLLRLAAPAGDQGQNARTNRGRAIGLSGGDRIVKVRRHEHPVGAHSCRFLAGGRAAERRHARRGHSGDRWKDRLASIAQLPAANGCGRIRTYRSESRRPTRSNFGLFDAGGWDEVFPTVDPCRVPNSAWGDRTLTDHGELWYRPWQMLEAKVVPDEAASN